MINKEQTETKPKTQEGKSEAPGLAGKAHDAAEQVRSATVDRVNSARRQADSAKAHAAERVRTIGTAFRKVGEHLRVEEQLYMADRATDASQRIEKVADYIASAELNTLLQDAEDAARSNPALVFGGTFLAGLVAGRFLKSASPSAEATGVSRTQEASDARETRSAAAGGRSSEQGSATRSATTPARPVSTYTPGSTGAHSAGAEVRGASPALGSTGRNGNSDSSSGARR